MPEALGVRHLRVALVEVVVLGVVASALAARAGLDRVRPGLADPLVGHERALGVPGDAARSAASAMPSSIDWFAPWPRCGSIGCAASPSSVSRPLVQVGSGSPACRAPRKAV